MSQDLFALPEAAAAHAVGPLFVAAVPSPDAARQIAGGAARLQAEHHLVGRLRPPQVLHVTLADLSACPHPEDLVKRALGVVLGRLRHAAFEVAFDHIQSVDTGSDSAPCVLRGGRGTAELKALQAWLRKSLADVGLDTRRLPAPHMTLLYGPERLPDCPAEAVAWKVNELVLVRSHVGQTRHEILGRWPLQHRGMEAA